jgi:hypothetical protein
VIFRPDGITAPCSTVSTTASPLSHRIEKSLAAGRTGIIEMASKVALFKVPLFLPGMVPLPDNSMRQHQEQGLDPQ